MERTRHVAPQLVGLNPPFAQREVRAGARPQRPLVGTGDRHEEGPQRRDRFELGEQPERPFHAHRRERRAHTAYSFILRVSVVRWIPRISAAAPLCPLGWASTRAMWRASRSADRKSVGLGKSVELG